MKPTTAETVTIVPTINRSNNVWKRNALKLLMGVFIVLGISLGSKGQSVYTEDFGNTASIVLPYSFGTNPTGNASKNANLGTPSWSQNLANAQFAGNTLGCMSATTGTNAYVITCTFTVNAGYKLIPTSIGFDNRGSAAGPTSLTISIFGTGGSTSCSPTPSRTGAFTTTAATNFASTTLNLTGTITLTLTFTGGAASSTERVDNIILNGSVCQVPSIANQPVSSQTVCQNGTPTNLTVTAAGTGMAYQWYSSVDNANNTPTDNQVGTNSPSFTPPTNIAGPLFYYCVITGTCGTTITNTAAVIVNAPPFVSAQPPLTTTACENSTPTIAITATGTSPSYQWQVSTNGGGSYTNLTNTFPYTADVFSNQMSIVGVPATFNGYKYRCVVQTSGCVAVVSDPTTLTVNPTPGSPAGLSSQSFCSGATVASLTAAGSGIQWYNQASGGTVYNNTQPLVDGQHYYASQTSNGCESIARLDVTASYLTYTITKNPGTGGTIGGPTTVNCGDNATYTISPLGCYSIADVVVDGLSQGAIGTYTFTNVQANHTISASFVQNTYTITKNAGTGGTITGPTTVNCGSEANFTITPNACFAIANVIVDGNSIGAVGSYTFPIVTANHSISATFTATTPAPPVVSVTQPDCTTSTGTINVATVAGEEYSLDGGAYQTSGTFSGVSVNGVTWTTLSNMTASNNGSTLTKTVSPGSWSDNFATTASFPAASGGFLRAKANAAWGFLIGFIEASTPYTVRTSPDYLVEIDGLTLWNRAGAVIGSYANGDVISIDMSPARVVTVNKNGIVIYTYPATATGSWRRVTSIFTGFGRADGLGMDYHLVRARNAAGCVSAPAQVAIFAHAAAPAAPTGDAAQTLCNGATVADLSAVGTNIVWYNASSGGTAYPPSTPLTDGQHYYAVQTSDGCESATRLDVTVSLVVNGTWLGKSSNAWGNPANWCGGVPTSTTNVVIPSTAPNQPLISVAASCNSININSGASLTMSPVTLSVHGNFINNGTFLPNSGTVQFSGTTDQSIEGTSVINFNNLINNKSSGNTNLNRVVSVSGTLTFLGGNVFLGGNNFVVNSITGPLQRRCVVTNGSGNLIMNVPAAPAITVLAVGATGDSYDPVSLSPTVGGSFSVHVKPTTSAADFASPVADYNKVVHRQWEITPLSFVPGSTGMTLTNGGDSYEPVSPVIGHYTGSAWEEIPATYGSGVWTTTTSNFSPFGAGGAGGFTPAACIPTNITLGLNPAVCRGIITANLPYTSVTGGADQYEITYSPGALAQGFVNVSYTTLPSSPIVLTVPGGATPGTYNGSISVKNSGAPCPGMPVLFTVTIHPLPVVTCPADFAVCINLQPFDLGSGSGPNTPATPPGGTYTGPGVTANIFDPVAAGAGTHLITYTYTSSSTGCTSTCAFRITVNALPVVTCPTYAPVCISTAQFTLAGGSPAGGTYSGPGVVSGSFAAGAAGVGTHAIVYSYTDPVTGCTNSCIFYITVNPNPTITLGTSPTVYSGTSTANLPYTATTGGPNSYSIVYDGAALSAGFLNTSGGMSPSPGNIILTVPAPPVPAPGYGVYHGTITVTNTATGCSGAPVPFTVTVTDITFRYINAGNYVTAINWDPYYPGRNIPRFTTIFFNGSCSVTDPITNDGDIIISTGGTLENNNTITSGGTFTNHGTYKGTGLFTGSLFTNPADGVVAPGASPGCLSFGMGYTNAGTLNIEANGLTPCTQHDKLNVTGTATVGGVLNFIVGYTPTSGDEITFIDATTVSGTFTTVNAPSNWTVQYNYPTTGKVTMKYLVAGASTYYVNDNSLVGDINGGTVGNDANPGTASSPFLTIGHAISVAAAGSTIHVDAGTYAESTAPDKELIILGANATISPNGGVRNAESIMTSPQAFRPVTISAVAIKGFKFTTTAGNPVDCYTTGANITLEKNLYDATYGMFFANSALLTIADNKFVNLDVNYEGLFIAGNWNGTTGTVVSMHDNAWTASSTSAMNLSNVKGNIYRNSITGVTYYGILVANSCDLNIYENTFSGIINPGGSPTWGAGVRFYTPQPGLVANIHNNFFTGNAIGIGLRNVGGDGSLAGTSVTIASNSFSGNTDKNIVNQAAQSLTATCNWFGSDNLATVTASMSQVPGAIVFVPYLSSGADLGGNAADGFQPSVSCVGSCTLTVNAVATDATCPSYNNGTATANVISGGVSPYTYLWSNGATTATIGGLAAGPYTVTVTDATGCSSTAGVTVNNSLTGPVHNVSTGFYYCSIQAAINAASSGNIIEVAAGTFNESLNINKTLTLKGAQYNICAPTRTGAETIINCTSGIGINASNVILNGFTIQGQTDAISGPGFGFTVYMAPPNTGTKLLNNIIKNNIVGVGLSNAGAAPAQVQISCNWFDNNNATGPASGHAIYVDEFVSGGAVSNVMISQNKFSGHTDGGGAIGIYNSTQAVAVSGLTIDANEFSANLRAMFLYNVNNSTVTNNEISGSTFTASGEVRVLGGVNNLYVANNKFIANEPHAIRITDDGAGATSSNITVYHNSFTGYSPANIAVEVESGYVGSLKATCNWWGTTVVTDVAAQTSGPVTYIPFLTSGIDASPSIGFQTNAACIANADPALVSIDMTNLSNAAVNPNQIPFHAARRIFIPVLNLTVSPQEIIPAGTTKLRISLGTKLDLNTGYNVATSPLNAYFNWTRVVEVDSVVIYGDQIADIPGGFADVTSFDVMGIGATGGSSTIKAIFQITNHNNPTYTLVDNNMLNDTVRLQYTELNQLVLNFVSKQNITCAGTNTGSITVQATGGLAPYQYRINAGPWVPVSGTSLPYTFTGLAAATYTIEAMDATSTISNSISVTLTQPPNPDVSLGSQFDTNLFFNNGDEAIVVYNISELLGKAATPATLRVFKPAGYDIIFNNALTSVSIGGPAIGVDNPKWVMTAGPGNFYYDITRTGPGGGNQINCSELVRISITVKRNTTNISQFNLNAQFRAATGELILSNNNNSIIMSGE